MRTLTNEQLIEAAQKAWDENRLACQHKLTCLYFQVGNLDDRGETGVVCGIGAALTPEEIDQIIRAELNNMPTRYLQDRDIVAFKDSQFAEILQEAHDDGYDIEHKYFRQMIGR